MGSQDHLLLDRCRIEVSLGCSGDLDNFEDMLQLVYQVSDDRYRVCHLKHYGVTDILEDFFDGFKRLEKVPNRSFMVWVSHFPALIVLWKSCVCLLFNLFKFFLNFLNLVKNLLAIFISFIDLLLKHLVSIFTLVETHQGECFQKFFITLLSIFQCKLILAYFQE